MFHEKVGTNRKKLNRQAAVEKLFIPEIAMNSPCAGPLSCHIADPDCARDWVGYAHRMTIELEQEDDGRWIAEAPQIPGALAYGGTQAEAIMKVEALVLRILADRLDHGEIAPELDKVFTVAA